MKKRLIYFAVILYLMTISLTKVTAQKLEEEKTHQLSKDAKKGYLGSFKYDENTREYTMVFVREKKKKAVYVTYKFDYDFNLKSENEEVLTDLEASKKFDFMEFTEEPWQAPEVIRVDGDGFNALQVTLKKGSIERRWVPASTTTVGNYTWYIPGYWKFDFEVKEKFKPQIEVKVDIDPAAPKFVKKLLDNAAKKIKLVAYQTDEPGFEVNTSRMMADLYGRGKGTMNYMGKAKAYAGSSGDILLVGYQEWFLNKEQTRRFVAVTIGSDNMAIKKQSIIEFDYIYSSIFTKNFSDKSIGIVLAPSAMGVPKGSANENPTDYYYIRVNKNAEVVEKIQFNSPSSFWNINDIVEGPDGDVYIYGAALKSKNDKHYDKLINTTKFDNFQLMKIKAGKMEYITSTTIEEFKNKLQFPSNMKKVDSYDGKKFAVGPMTVTSNGDVFISGQEANDGKYGNINLFQFTNQGKLIAQYGYRLEETSKEATSQATGHVEFENTDGNTLTWIIYEMNGSTSEKLLLYPRVSTIDIKNKKVSDFVQYGYTKKEAYFVDNTHPIVMIDNFSKAVFFGADKKDKMLWFARVKLGQ